MNRKKIAAIVLFGLVLNTCASPAIGEMNSYVSLNTTEKTSLSDAMKKHKAEQELLLAKAAEAARLQKNTELINNALDKLNTYVGKTWYVFSGATPSGWDCSGLTMWFYEQVGISLEHRASVQDSSGVETSDPNVGDIVVFTYDKSSEAYHVGIYVGNGKMIHAPKIGHVTRVEDISTFGGSYSKVSYRKLIDTI